MSDALRSRSGSAAALLLVALASCATLDVQPSTATSGRFVSTGLAFTILSIDLPKPALNIARDNASDSRLTNMQVTETSVVPNLGWFDWLFDIIGIRYARVSGTWGFTGDEPGSAGAKPGSNPGS